MKLFNVLIYCLLLVFNSILSFGNYYKKYFNVLKFINYYKIAVECNQRIICHFQSWSIQELKEGVFSYNDIDLNLCTDIMYSGASLNNHTLLIIPKSEDYHKRYKVKVIHSNNYYFLYLVIY